ncbi:RebB family R body protein [Sneathiella sp. CAU 1612]|uniref:RebB family R body protein n=1 Tax=Sneathiella sedimenti TaxID=2816034 RepID=A0ABS3F5Y1_9PROT|nr:RebB family R body protein [Sneathiella sedimenti]MBO0333789.1 RebB family R body protein [Sneathiella sedimenti]
MANSQSDEQIKNSIMATNEILLGSSTSKSMATMYLNLAHAAGMASQNAVTNQQHLNILGAAAVAAGTSGLLRTGMADQIEKLTPAERLDYLQKLLTLATNPAAGAAAATDGTDSAQSTGTGTGDNTSTTRDSPAKSDGSATSDTTASDSSG